jgi:hypothetical protein
MLMRRKAHIDFNSQKCSCAAPAFPFGIIGAVAMMMDGACSFAITVISPIKGGKEVSTMLGCCPCE